ncbi:His-Xaa-Ser system radical SAM maturase HxsB [Candidatus Azambacteria bacterium RBG_16_47_10]|uniref:His-Xaa-Ser system radical SAM maturase HxsB n=1 Tax=Candidatus Azambacteria bacterium RBG_16_47_10 TaxID=1797292 RepID=A0A1F5B188_9BACT|nr:MAG: His-Xaa-Ser system radical SAM maturase HxsB [Candidatus Azambacteria bacterium RBG_16_47_10]
MEKQKYSKKKVNYFRYRKMGDKHLITNDFGNFAVLSGMDYATYVAGKIPETSALFAELAQKGFIKDRMNFAELIRKFQSKNAFIKLGPSLHIIVVTLRCNHTCLYCHASSGPEKNKELDMPVDLAKDVVDAIFKTNNQNINIEFQGGEPLLNWDVVKFIIEYSREKQKIDKKNVQLSLVSNFSLMTDEKLNFLLKNQVSLSTSFDGPSAVHNKNRVYLAGNSYENVVKWLKKSLRLYKKNCQTFLPGALTTITRYTLPYYKELVDEYVSLGLPNIYIRNLNPFGFAKKTWEQIGYTPEEFIDFYKKSMEYIIGLNLKGKKIREQLAVTFLTKILTDHDPNHMDYRSPCGAGIGQVAYNYNGDIYTCDEGRMFGRVGDDSFKMGNVRENSYKEIMESDVVKSMCLASCLDAIPGCNECAYKPYCGVCPVYNYSEQGNIFGQMPTNGRCKINMAVFDYLFEKMQDKKVKMIFEEWVRV